MLKTRYIFTYETKMKNRSNTVYYESSKRDKYILLSEYDIFLNARKLCGKVSDINAAEV